MSNTGPLPLSAVMRVAGVSGTKVVRGMWHANSFNVKSFLKLSEYVDLINNIMKSVMSGNGEVAYELIDFSIRLNVITAYANIELPEDIDYLHYVVCGTDLYDVVCSYINKYQIKSVERTIMAALSGQYKDWSD